MSKKDLIRVGVIGVRRGECFAHGAVESVGMKLVAICDSWQERLKQAEKNLNVTTYTDYDKFLEHDMDAVILANFFHQHAPFAVKALKAGKHVMSETAACSTVAEGVELIEAVEKSGKIYMFAENYPYMVFNQEMRRLYQAGKIGTFMYGEGEYVHPMSADDINRISPGVNHWRNWIPATYYCTHALAPIMFITDSMPVKVNGFVMPWTEDNPVRQRVVHSGDAASMIAVRMDNGAVAKLLQYGLRGHGIWVRIHGSKGLMENLRTGDRNMLRVVREQYHQKRTDPEEMIYLPDFPEHHDQAAQFGHGGGDFFMNYHFANAIRTGKQPYLDVYRGVAMSIVGIQAYRSALDDSNTLEIPDFRIKSNRAKYKNDTWTPDPARRGKNGPWPSILGKVTPSEKALAYAKKIWRQNGYTGE
ncbi:MAG: Gfo/Idh/MocA family oxidoreductase [Phycisphaerae bacterium]|nr:Gfo/Idh/MocA family oxidoreductase [Phycisphaerae bacterium]